MKPVAQEYIIHISASIKPITRSTDLTKEIILSVKGNYSAAFARDIRTIEDKLENLKHRISLVSTDNEYHVRNRREIFSSVGNFMKSSFGVLNNDDKSEIRTQIFILRKQQLEEVHQMEAVKNNSVWMFDKVAETIDNVNIISKKIEENLNESQWGAHRYAILNELKEAAFECGNAVDALYDVVQRRQVQGKIITAEQLEELFERLKSNVSQEQEIAFSSAMEIIAAEKIQVRIAKEKLFITIVVPSVLKNESWKIFEIQFLPVIQNNLVIMLQSRFKFVVKRNGSHLMEIASLNKCITNDKREKVCKVSGSLFSEDSDSCITRLFRTQEVDQGLCKNNVIRAKLDSFLAVRIGSEKIRIFTSTPIKVKISCNGRTEEIKIESNSEISTHEACRIEIGSSMFFTSHQINNETVTIRPVVTLEDFKFQEVDLIKLPTIKNGKGSEIEEIKVHLSELQQRKLLLDNEEAFTNHKKSMWVAIGSAVSSIAGMLLLVIIICCCIRF